MFYVWNNHRVALCGLTVLAAIGASAAAPLGHRVAVPLGDLMCRLQKVNQTDAAGSTQTRSIDCVYQSLKGGVEEFYTGTLSTIGLNIRRRTRACLRGSSGGRKTQISAGFAGAELYGGDRDSRRSSAVFGWRYAKVHHPLAGSPRHDASPPAPIIAAMQLEQRWHPPDFCGGRGP